MNPPQTNTIINGPNGEHPMAFKEPQKPPNFNQSNNVRPQLIRTDSRVNQGFPGQGASGPQGYQGGQAIPQQGHPGQQQQGPRPLNIGPGQNQPQFRPPPQNFPQQQFQQQSPQQFQQQQQQRFSQPGQNQGQPQNQPLFRPQQRFVAVNPPGTVRPNLRAPPPNQVQRPQRPPGPYLPQQQSFAGTLPAHRSFDNPELQRSQTLESENSQPPQINSVKNDEKEEIKPQEAKPPINTQIQDNNPALPPEVVPSPVAQPQVMEKPQVEPKPQHVVEPVVPPPNTLALNTSVESKNSSSPSPQPESVIEVKPQAKQEIKTEEKQAEKEPQKDKPPKIPKTPTKATRPPSRNKKGLGPEGDNDSGVDESTQGTEHSNGDHSPRKTLRNSSRLTTPTKNRSFSRGSRSPHLTSPDSQPGTPGPTEKKKLPMNKIQVGAAPAPNLKVVKSKIGSLANANHKPGGGHIRIEHRKIDVSNATSRIGAKNENYAPTGGEKKIISQKLQWNAKSKIGSLENAHHKPKGGDKKIESVKLDFKDKAKPKVGSKDNIQHAPGGGDIKQEPENQLVSGVSEMVNKQAKNTRNESAKKPEIPKKFVNENEKNITSQIIDRKLNIQAESKIGSLENMKHKPGGGEKKIFDDKEYLRQISASGMSNENDSVCGSQNSLPSQHSHHSDSREPVSDENLNTAN